MGGGGQEHALESVVQNFNQPGNVSHILWNCLTDPSGEEPTQGRARGVRLGR